MTIPRCTRVKLCGGLPQHHSARWQAQQQLINLSPVVLTGAAFNSTPIKWGSVRERAQKLV